MAKAKSDSGVVETIKTIVYALLIAGVIRTLFFQPFFIPSGSMKSTLLIGDFLFVNKMAYGYSKHSCPFSICPISGRIWASEPEVGDVVVFKHPVSNVDYIKRLVATPGQTVQMKEGRLFINGEALKVEPSTMFIEPKVEQGGMRNIPACANAPVGIGGECMKLSYREYLPNGIGHTILNIGKTRGDDTPLFTVPEGHYFFMGDNRDNSLDSRFPISQNGVGFVPFENLVGRADRVIFSSAGRSMLFFWTWRSDRFFKGIE